MLTAISTFFYFSHDPNAAHKQSMYFKWLSPIMISLEKLRTNPFLPLHADPFSNSIILIRKKNDWTQK